MSLIDTRFLNLVSSLFLDACAGSPYAVSLYSAQLKTQLQLTQVQLNTVESAGDVGLYLTVVAGVAYESIGPKATAAVGAFLSLAGYALMWLAVNGNAASSVPALALYAFLWNHGSSWLSTCAVTTAIKSMTGDRGVAMGLVRSMFGLSAALLGVIYFSTFQPSATAAAAAGNASVASASLASYFLFCAITFTGIALVAGLAARVPSPAESAAPLRQAEQLRIVWAGVIVALLVFYVTGAGVAGAHGSLPPSPAWAFALLALLLPLLGLVFRQRVYAALADYFCCCGRKAAATADSAADVDAVVAATIKRNHSSGLLVSVASSSSVASMTMGSHHYSADTDAAGADESVNALSAPLLEGAAETGMMHPATPTRSGSAMVVTSGAGFSLPEGGSDAEPMVLHLDDPTARAPVIVYSHSGRTPGSSSVAAELAVAAAAAAGASGMFAPHPAAEFDDEATATSDAAPGRVGGDAVAKQLPATPTFASAGRRESLAALSAKRTASSSRAAAAASVPRLAIADDGQPATRSSNARVDSGSAAVAVTADVHRRHRVAADPTFTDDSDLPLPLSKEVGASLCEAVCGLDYLLILLCLFAGTGCGIVVINNLSNLVESLAGGPGSLPTGGELPYLILFSTFNCKGRLIAGWASDRFAPSVSRPFFMTMALLSCAGAMLLTAFSGLGALYAAVAWTGLSFGAWWSLGPALVADRFGERAFASIYGLSSIASGFASFLLSTLLAGRLYEAHTDVPAPGPPGEPAMCIGHGCFRDTFLALGGLALLAACLSVWLAVKMRPLYRGPRGKALRYDAFVSAHGTSQVGLAAQACVDGALERMHVWLCSCCCRSRKAGDASAGTSSFGALSGQRRGGAGSLQ